MSRVRSVGGTRRFPLEQGWEFAAAAPGSGIEQLAQLDWHPARAPNTAAGALRDAGLWSFDTPRDFDAFDWWWRIALTAANAPVGPAVLGFDGLATLADVWLDGINVLRGDNMFVGHRLHVALSGSHELLIRCAALAPELAMKRPRPRWRVPMLAHAQLRWFRTTLLGRTPGWSPPCPPVGPWRPIWLEQRALEVAAVTLRSTLEGSSGIVEVSADLGSSASAATLIVERNGQRVLAPLALAGGSWSGRARVSAAQRWWPHTHGEPALYALSIEARRHDEVVTIDLGNTGFRTIEVDRADGDFGVRVNGVDVFSRGACWTPLDVVTLAAEPARYREAIAQARAAGMNMLRVGGTMVYEDDAFYDALDEQGVLLWQDLMFANMDYPEEDAFVAGVLIEVEQQLARLQARPCLALVCGNSEGEQQAAMSGAARALWSPRLFHQTIAERVHALGIPYTPSSAHGGAFPHAANAGACSYYGVGAYRRPLQDARRAELRFASECLAFANIPYDGGLPGAASLRMHHPAWKARSPRDLGAGWDFDDVRDHYVERLYRTDPIALRASDHERYVALGRAATGEVMADAFAEWRRLRSPTRGALVWFLRDLWPGAGWGVIDAHGVPKPCYYALRRALAPVALTISDEGVNGLAIHVANDRAEPFAAELSLSLYRLGDLCVGSAATVLQVPARAALEIAATTLFEGFLDLSFAYRFGPAMADFVHAVLRSDGKPVAETFWFPLGLPSSREADVGLGAIVHAGASAQEPIIEITTRRFAQSVTIDAPGFVADDNGFHLAPGQSRAVVLRALGSPRALVRASVSALNAEASARFELRCV
ncbi:MAG: glycoside hydrolase family 2 protein [Dokdonella sp.]